MLGGARRGPLIPSGERSCTGVRDPRRYPKFMYGCERLTVLSEKLCVGVRGPRYKSKSFVAQKKTHGHVYHLDLELSDRSWD